MPATYTIDVAARLVLSHATGTLTDEDLFDHQARLRVDPLFQPTFRQIADFRDITTFAISSAAVRRLASVPIYAPKTPRALVVPKNAPVAYGLARMFELSHESIGGRVMVFYDYEEARRWVDTAEE